MDLIDTSILNAKKVAVVGNAGSGKTTVSICLHEISGLPLYHLDLYYWKSGWQRVNLGEFIAQHAMLCKKDAWIIEGPYIRVLRERVEQADAVIYLDIPRRICLWNCIRRSILNWGKELPGSPKGCTQRLFSIEYFKFLAWVWNFNKRYRAQILEILNEFKDSKQIYIFKSMQEVNRFLQNLDQRS